MIGLNNKKEKEELFTHIRAHHLHYGEGVSFNCPHCSKEIAVQLKTLELDPDVIEVYWGKSFEEIEEQREKVHKKFYEET